MADDESDDYEDDFEDFEADDNGKQVEGTAAAASAGAAAPGGDGGGGGEGANAPAAQPEVVEQFRSPAVAATQAGGVKQMGSLAGGPWVPQMRFFLRKHTAGVNDCAVDPRGRFVATVSDDQSSLVWAADSGKLLCSLHGGASTRSEVRTCSFNADGALLATGAASGAVELWDANSGGALGGEEMVSWPCFRALENAHSAAVNCVAWMPLRGSKTLLSVGDDKRLRWWECSTSHCAATCDFELRSAGNAVAAAPDGRVVVAGCEDGSVDVHVVANTSKGWKLLSTVTHSSAVTACAFRNDPDPNAHAEAGHPYTLATMSRGAGAVLCVWRVDPERSKCELLHRLPGQTGYNICTKPCFLWEPPEEPEEPSQEQVGEAAAGPNGHSGEQQAGARAAGNTLGMHKTAVRLLVPLGQEGSDKGAVCVVDEAGAVMLGVFRAHGENTRAVSASADGAVFATCSTNDHVKVWLAPAAARRAKQRAERERMAHMRARVAEQQAKDDAKKAKAVAAAKKAEEKKRRKKADYEEAAKAEEEAVAAQAREAKKAAAAEAERQAVAAKMEAAMAMTEKRQATEATLDAAKNQRRHKSSARRQRKEEAARRKEEQERAERAAEIDGLL